jgi:hypothetical protein
MDILYSAPRLVIWPEKTTLQTKLYGPRQELEITANIFAMELDMQAVNKKTS